jgi:hypothetical protein
MLKTDMLARLYKLKTELYENEQHVSKTGQWQDGAHYAYNKVLDILQEYRQ